MPKPRDCIYCSARADSGEHTFVAGLGGRRTNKGILCNPCDQGFASLDGLLVAQLAGIRGLLGVRPDHRDGPVPALVDTGEGPMRIDGAGRPSWSVAKVRSDVLHENGTRTVTVEASDEAQLNEWLDGQRALGIDVRKMSRSAGQRFLPAPAQISWSFGGEEAFREIARIALNILAQRNPEAARVPGLSAIKGWIRGERLLADGEGPYVWYQDGSITLPPCPFAFGHRVALRLAASAGTLDATVTFFDAIEFIVSFGPVGMTSDDLVVFEIDPLADSPPHDLRVESLGETVFPHLVIRPESSAITATQHDRLRTRFPILMERIEDRQNRNLLGPICEQLNQARNLSERERHDAIETVVTACRGHVLRLLRYASADMMARATSPETRFVAEAFSIAIQPNASSGDGLSDQARACLLIAEVALGIAIEEEVAGGALSLERTILLFCGRPGVKITFGAVLKPFLAVLKARGASAQP